MSSAPFSSEATGDIKPNLQDNPRPKKRSKKNGQDDPKSARPGPSKPRGKACAECKRMKLRCDRVFPCQTCIKRGLEGICPEGSLVTGRGTRYVLASTEALHEKIRHMSERIRVLEEALQSLHLEHSACMGRVGTASTHPLLQEDLLRVKGEYELYGLNSPTTAHAPQHQNLDRGNGSRRTVVVSPPDSDASDSEMDDHGRGMSDRTSIERHRNSIGQQELIASSPVESRMQMAVRLRDLLPDRLEAERLYTAACTNAVWIMNLRLSTSSLLRDLHAVYDAPPSVDLPRDIALLLIILAIGARTDIHPRDRRRKHEDLWRKDSSATNITRSPSDYDYYCKCRAVLAECAIDIDPDVRAVKCVLLIAWYHASLSDHKDAGRQATAAMNLAAKLALKLELQYEETYEKLSLEERQELRILFWGLLHAETRISIGTNKLPLLSQVEITCKRPLDVVHSGIPSFQTPLEAVFHDFKVAFVEKCFVPVLQMISKLHAPHGLDDVDYIDVLELDAYVRDFPVPDILTKPIIERREQAKSVDAPSHVLSLLRSRVTQETHMALLQLHRLYYVAHVRDDEPIIQRGYLPSAFATFGSACALIKSVQDIWIREPEISACVSAFFYNAFTGAMSLFILAMMKPSCPVTPLALEELDNAVQLFKSASSRNYMAARSYSILRGFKIKAQEVYDKWREHSEDDVQVFGDNGEIYLCYSRIDVILRRLQSPAPFTSTQRILANRMNMKSASRGHGAEEARPRNAYSTSEVRDSAKPDYVKDAPEDPSVYDMWLHVHRDITDVVRRMPDALKEAKIDPRRAIASVLMWDFIPLDEHGPKETIEFGRYQPATSQRYRSDSSHHSHHGARNGVDWSKVVDALASTTTSNTSPRTFSSPHSPYRELPTPPSSETPPSVNINLESQTFFPIMDTCAALGCDDANMSDVEYADSAKISMEQMDRGYGRLYSY